MEGEEEVTAARAKVLALVAVVARHPGGVLGRK